MRPVVTLYTRAGCCLCEVAKAVIEQARGKSDFEYREIDIDTDPKIRSEFNDFVPVIAIDGVKAFKYRVELKEFLKKLAART